MRIHSTIFTLAAMGIGVLLAQAPKAERQEPATQGKDAKQERIAALKQSLAANQAALKQYAWTETTQIKLKGEVKRTTQKECQYGPDGKVIKTPIGTPGQPQEQAQGGRRGGRIKKDIIEHKVEELKDYMEQVAAVVHQYAPPDPQKIQAAQSAGNVDVKPSQPVTTMTIKNYAKQGDSVALGFDVMAKKIVSYSVNSYVEKPKDDALTLAVSFAPLADGTNHVQQSVLNVEAKKIEVTVTNSNYHKLGQ